MEQAKALLRWERIRNDMLRRADPYVREPRRPDWKPENEAKDKPLSKVTPEEATANLTRLVSEYPSAPVVLSEEAMRAAFGERK